MHDLDTEMTVTARQSRHRRQVHRTYWRARGTKALAVTMLLIACSATSMSAQGPSSLSRSAPTGARATDDAHTATTTSVLIGGFAVGQSRLALAKIELVHGQWAVIGDMTRDAVTQTWETTAGQQASRGSYRLWAGSGAIRRYSRSEARGFFVEAGGGGAQARLAVTPASGPVAVRTAIIPLATAGVGGRAGIGAGRAFVELGLRSAIPITTRHLYTDATAPDGSTSETVSYRSWYFGRAKPTSQFYAGLGASF
jgi:hypothetical protein